MLHWINMITFFSNISIDCGGINSFLQAEQLYRNVHLVYWNNYFLPFHTFCIHLVHLKQLWENHYHVNCITVQDHFTFDSFNASCIMITVIRSSQRNIWKAVFSWQVILVSNCICMSPKTFKSEICQNYQLRDM